MKKIILGALALAAAGGIGYAAGAGNIPSISTLNPKAMKLILPENIKWGPAAGLTGTDSYTLVGGEGPGTGHECEGPTAEKGPGPCADARKAAGWPPLN